MTSQLCWLLEAYNNISHVAYSDGNKFIALPSESIRIRSRTKKICKKIQYDDVMITSSVFDPIMYDHLVDHHQSMIPAKFRYNWANNKETIRRQKIPVWIGLKASSLYYVRQCLSLNSNVKHVRSSLHAAIAMVPRLLGSQNTPWSCLLIGQLQRNTGFPQLWYNSLRPGLSSWTSLLQSRGMMFPLLSSLSTNPTGV